MAETVFILGAGASHEAGAPLMADFLDTADRLFRKRPPDQLRETCALVFDAMDEMQRSAFKAQPYYENLEDVFAAFEMAQLIGRLGKILGADAEQLPDAMRRVIEATLDQTIMYPIGSEGEGFLVPSSHPEYDEFVKLLKDMTAKNGIDSVAVMTFNYDACLDLAFELRDVQVEYCLGDARGGRLKFLKLHGSVLWTECSGCGRLARHRATDQAKFAPLGEFGQLAKAPIPVPISSTALGKSCCAGSENSLVMVPPTWSKGEHHKRLASVWRSAAEALNGARHIVVIGYSLPPSDAFFRHLYALGSVGKGWIKSFNVFDPSKDTHAHFEQLLGPNPAARLHCYSQTFAQASQGHLRHVLRQASVI